MNILFLPNWSVGFYDNDNDNIQSPDKKIRNQAYWFFKYLPDDIYVDIIDVQKKSILYNFEKKLKFYIYQAFLAYRVQNKYDLIISHGAQSGVMLSLLRYIFGKKNTKHVIFDIGGMNGGKDKGFSTFIIQIAMKSKPYIIAHSTIILDNIKKNYPLLINQVKFIPFGLGLYQYKFEQVVLNDEIFVFSGHNRDTDTVFRAWKKIMKTKSFDYLTINFVGVKASDEYHAKNLRCIEKLSYGEYIKFLISSRFVILSLPVKKHSYGQMSLLGSLALGKNVIATNVPGIDDYMKDCDCITSVAPYNVNDMYNAIIKLALKNIKDNQISARQYVINDFSEEKMAIHIYNYIRDILYKD